MESETQAGPASEAEVFESWDYDYVVACLPPMGHGGMFQLWEDRTPRVWKFISEESPAWDSIHQNLFSQHRGERITDAAYLAALPPIPAVPVEPEAPPRTGESYYLPEHPLMAAEFPRFCAELSRRQADHAILKVTLVEDGYETLQGDGKFLYLDDAVLHPEDAPEFVDHEQESAQSGYGNHYYTRFLMVQRLEGQIATIDFPSFHLDTFEHYRPLEALRKCEGKLAASAVSNLA